MRKTTRGAKRPENNPIGRPKLRLVGVEMTEAERFEHLAGLLTEILSVAQSTQREVEILRVEVDDLSPARSPRQAAATADAADLLYGVPAVACHLGMTGPQVYHLTRSGTLPSFKIGGKVCVRRSDLDSWLARQSREGRA